MQKTRIAIALGLLSGLLSAPALAQPGSPGAGPAPAPSGANPEVDRQARDDTGFVGAMTDRWSAQRLLFGADVMGSSLNRSEPDSRGWRLELYGQYMAATSARRMGFYGTLPIAHFTEGGGSETSLGNPEIGGLYLPRITGLELVLRAGFVPSFGGGFPSFQSRVGRLTDSATQFPDTTTLRVSGSSMLRYRSIVARADLGLDVPLMSSDLFQEADAVARVNLAVGAELGRFAVAGELVNLVNLDSGESSRALGVSGHMREDDEQYFVSFVIPLDGEIRELLHFTVTLGVRRSWT